MCFICMVGLLHPVRPFPGDILMFRDAFRRCRNINCPNPQCLYAHSDLELLAWNKLKLDMLSMLCECHHYYYIQIT